MKKGAHAIGAYCKHNGSKQGCPPTKAAHGACRATEAQPTQPARTEDLPTGRAHSREKRAAPPSNGRHEAGGSHTQHTKHCLLPQVDERARQQTSSSEQIPTQAVVLWFCVGVDISYSRQSYEIMPKTENFLDELTQTIYPASAFYANNQGNLSKRKKQGDE